LTQEELARASGVSQKTISKIERGDQAASSAVVQLARACGVTPDWLAEGREAPVAASPGKESGDEPSGSWIMRLIHLMEVSGVPPEDAVRLGNEAAQLAKTGRVPVKRGLKKTG